MKIILFLIRKKFHKILLNKLKEKQLKSIENLKNNLEINKNLKNIYKVK